MPSPVPDTRDVMLFSSRSNGEKSLSMNAGDIPIPSSEKTKRYAPYPSNGEAVSETETPIWPPSGVNLRALESRFMNTC